MHAALARIAILVLWVSGSTRAFAQQTNANRQWAFATRLLVTGTNRSSEPAGFTVYTTFPLEAAIRRSVSPRFSLEFAARSESREVDQAASPTAIRLGSIEFLPINLLLQYRVGDVGGWRPYVGAGVNLTVAWEKSGTLDSMDVSPSAGPAIELGVDRNVSEHLALNLDFRWNTMRTNIAAAAGHVAKLEIDPSSLGFGLVVRF